MPTPSKRGIMKRLMVGIGFVAFLWSANLYAQSRAATPAAEAAHGSQASCVILKRMGRISRTESRLYHFGISGKQFRYVEGRLPEGFHRHGKMTDHDVRELQTRGAQVLVLDSNYSSEDLQEARADCQRGAGKMANQVEAKASPEPAPAMSTAAPAPGAIASPSAPTSKPLTAKPLESAPGPIASTSAPAPKPLIAKPPAAETPKPKARDSEPPIGPEAGTDAALLDVSSTPADADVYIDDRFSGRTPSTLILMPGDHRIAIRKNGFAVWKKKLKLPSGRNNVDAALLPKSK